MTTDERARHEELKRMARDFRDSREWKAREPHNKRAGVDTAKKRGRNRRRRRQANAWLRGVSALEIDDLRPR